MCRYWNEQGTDLRTKANSENTPSYCIQFIETHPQEDVDDMIRKYDIS